MNEFKDWELIDQYYSDVLPDIYHRFPIWSRINKMRLPASEDELGNKPRRLDAVKCIVSDLEFARFKEFEKGESWPDSMLESSDVRSQYEHCLSIWNELFYTGDCVGNPTEFDGLRFLIKDASMVPSYKSILQAIGDQISQMCPDGMRTSARKMPTAIYCNPMVQYFILQEMGANGIKPMISSLYMGNGVNQSV